LRYSFFPLVLAALLAGCGTPKLTPFTFGAKGDGAKLQDGFINAGQSTFVSPSASFTAADKGKPIAIVGAAVSGTDLSTTIAKVASATSVILADSALTTVSGAAAYYGTDDTAALRACIANGLERGRQCFLDDGVTFIQSNTASTIRVGGANPVLPGGLLDGRGTIVFFPRGPLTTYTNDRSIFIQSGEGLTTPALNPKQIAPGPIAKGATFFNAQNATDTAVLAPGDLVQVTEVDAGMDDVAYIDLVEVASVQGATVNLARPFRVSFPNLRTFNISGTPAPCIPARPCGLSFGKISPLVQDLTIRNINLVVLNIFDGKNRPAGIVTHSTRNLRIEGIHCTSMGQNCFAGYKDLALVYVSNQIKYDAWSDEFAAQISPKIIGNEYQNAPGVQNACILIDIGSFDFEASSNSCTTSGNDAYIISNGAHDGRFTNNTAGWVFGNRGAFSGIALIGTYDVTVSANTLAGGDPPDIGISTADATGYTVNILSDHNTVEGNTVTAFATKYRCSTQLGTDICH
jgi:hypothetical protein